MHTSDFLDHILPDVGLRVVVAIGPKGTWQNFYSDNLVAANQILRVDAQGFNVYHACATYKSSQSRTADNVQALKAFWLDIDCGDGKPYATQVAALIDLATFCKTLQIPAPTLVSSGKGLHAYWTLTESITPEDWLPTARLLKVITAHVGLRAGAERTADMASILRPPGSTHRKGDPIPVVVKREGIPSNHQDLHAALETYAATHGVSVDDAPGMSLVGDIQGDASVSKVFPLTDDLIYKPEYPVSNADLVADNCAIVGAFRDNGGMELPEPVWRGCLSVVRLCEDGENVAHLWSSQDPRYTKQETDFKLYNLKHIGPQLCATFHLHMPDVCQACPHFTSCKSPIQLGVPEPEAVEDLTVQASAPATTGFITSNIPVPPTLPHDFSWTGTRLTVKNPKAGTAGAPPTLAMTNVLFYPISNIENKDGTTAMQWRAHVSPILVKEFTLPNSLVGEPSKLISMLSSYQITVRPTMEKSLHKYFTAWIDHQRAHANTQTHAAYGWTDQGAFILGDRRYLPNGSVDTVVLSGTAQIRARNLSTKGDVNTWSDLVDRAYNNDQSRPWQFALLASMAAPLLYLLNTVHGVTVYMHSEESGFGKSTAEMVALSVWGTAEGLALSNQRVTINALAANLGAMRHLPAVLDELTAMDNKTACDLVHLISSGMPKERCNQAGDLLHREQSWRTIMLASGNVLLGEKMSMHRAHAEAEVARLWEYTIPSIPDADRVLQPADAFELFRQFHDHHGVAGDVFIRYIVQHKDLVTDLLNQTYQKIVAAFRLTQKERFWSALLACVFSAHKIASDLGLVAFPLAPLMQWCHDTLKVNRGGMVEAVTNYTDAFSQILSEFHGQMIVTEGKGSIYGGRDAHIYRHPTPGKPIVGRVIIQTPGPLGGPDMPAIYIAASAVKEWCNRNNVSYKEVLKTASASGLIRGATTRFVLGHGCPSYLPLTQAVECILVDFHKASGTIGQIGMTPLTVVAGGKPTTP